MPGDFLQMLMRVEITAQVRSDGTATMTSVLPRRSSVRVAGHTCAPIHSAQRSPLLA